MTGSALRRTARLDALVNNGGGQYVTPAEAIEPKGRRAATRLNLGATQRMTRLPADPAFLRAGAGRWSTSRAHPTTGSPGDALEHLDGGPDNWFALGHRSA